MRRIFPNSFYNLLTLIGAAVSSVSVGLIFFLVLLEATAANPNPYMGIIAFVLLPGFVLLGIALMVIGVLRENRRTRLGLPHGLRFPQLDLNNPRHRNGLLWTSIGSILLLGVVVFSSFMAYEHTESDQFCGETCHTVMEPEYTAYQFSPHARVGCVQCHIGSGASYFVKSKLSGSYQLYAVTFNKYPKPIPTPIENLRPAQETCEQCHWPKHFYSEKMLKNTYFLSDSQNTRWMLELLIKIGGGNVEAGPTSGIHWHMNIAHEVNYATLDSSRQTIPWVTVKNPDGSTRTYQLEGGKLSDEEFGRARKHRMDCIDCHNRPSHIYRPPARSINHVMDLGWIDENLPYAKSVAVKALENNYSSKSAALDSIRLFIGDYYQEHYPLIALEKKASIERIIAEVQKIYSRNYFPSMQVSWRKFPDNIGHMYYPGCFRCHDGKHKSDDGKVLSRDCNICHTILAQKFEKDRLRLSLTGIEYVHPVDIGTAWKEMNCSDCHNS
jgi:hypothetical protein